MSINTDLWDSVFKTDPKYTKGFSRAGGFKGTAISPMYLMHRATETFGPIGIGWGFRELESKIEAGVWFSKVQLWYLYNTKRGEVEQWGATVLTGTNKNGAFVDEEAAKKSVTDGVTKCLSYIGFAADVHIGLFDDSKYVAGLKEEKTKQQEEPPTSEVVQLPKATKPSLREQIAAIKGAVPEGEFYRVLGMEGATEVEEIPGKEAAIRILAALKALSVGGKNAA